MNVLIISNFAGFDKSIGSRRVNLIAQEFSRHGHEVSIARISALPGKKDIVCNPANIYDVPVNCFTRFVAENLSSEHRLKRSLARLLYAMGVIDHYIWSWLLISKFLLSLARSKKIDLVISSSPSFSCVFFGYLLKRRLGVRLVSDNRDWWSLGEYNVSKSIFLRYLRERVERYIHKRSDLITTISNSAARWYLNRFQMESVGLLTGVTSEERPPVSMKPGSVVYAGSLYGGKRRLDLLLEALDCEDLKAKVNVILVGPERKEFKAFAGNFPNLDITVTGPVSKKEADNFTAGSQFSIILLGDGEFENQIVPGKFFELLAHRKPIVCVGPISSEIGLLISKHKLGICTRCPIQIRAYIKACFSGDLTVQSLVPQELLVRNTIGRLVHLMATESHG